MHGTIRQSSKTTPITDTRIKANIFSLSDCFRTPVKNVPVKRRWPCTDLRYAWIGPPACKSTSKNHLYYCPFAIGARNRSFSNVRDREKKFSRSHKAKLVLSLWRPFYLPARFQREVDCVRFIDDFIERFELDRKILLYRTPSG